MSSERLPRSGRTGLSRTLEAAIWIAGLGLIAYLSLSVFGLVSRGPVFYVNFAMAIVAMSGLLALSEIDAPSEIEGEAGRRVRAAGLHWCCWLSSPGSAGWAISGGISTGWWSTRRSSTR